MGHHSLSEFDGIVNKESGRYKRDQLSDSDDIKQELSLKLVKELPALQKVPIKEAKAIVRSIVENYVHDIQRKSVTRAPLNKKLKERESHEGDGYGAFTWEDAADCAFMSLKTYVPTSFVCPEEACSYSMLAAHMEDWAQHKGGKIAILIREMLTPSENVLGQWKTLMEESPTNKRFETIPPVAIGKMFGMSKLTVRNAMKGLKSHLVDVGYREDYVKGFVNTAKVKGKK